jgi:pimeloyl-ACP methyl ester carboxylesterase
VWAVAHVSGAVSGLSFELVVPEELAGADQITRDFAVWAPLGADDVLRRLWYATPKARGLPTGADLLPRPEPRAGERLDQIAVPTLVVSATRDPVSFREVGRTVARRVPGARLVEIDSDHYLPLRVPAHVAEVLLEFLGVASTDRPSAAT